MPAFLLKREPKNFEEPILCSVCCLSKSSNSAPRSDNCLNLN